MEIKFGQADAPYTLGYTCVNDLDTIYICNALESMQKFFEESYVIINQDAKLAAEIYLQEYYSEVLTHETAHLVLGKIAKEDNLDIRKCMRGYHNTIVERVEGYAHRKAVAKAIECVQAKYIQV